jgi:hypothetical protein
VIEPRCEPMGGFELFAAVGGGCCLLKLPASSLFHSIFGCGEGSADLRAEGFCGNDNADCDQCSDEAVFDGRCT